MLKSISVKEAVGCTLAHDITEIRAGEFKGAPFRKGHVVRQEDICHLQRLGKNHLYVIDLSEDEIHEDEAAAILAQALAGEGIGKADLAFLGHGGLCRDCPECRYPLCPFGKGF